MEEYAIVSSFSERQKRIGKVERFRAVSFLMVGLLSLRLRRSWRKANPLAEKYRTLRGELEELEEKETHSLREEARKRKELNEKRSVLEGLGKELMELNESISGKELRARQLMEARASWLLSRLDYDDEAELAARKLSLQRHILESYAAYEELHKDAKEVFGELMKEEEENHA